MNPEDLLRELRDSANWNAKPTVRTGVFVARRRLSPLVASIASIAAVAVLLVIVFSALGGSIRGLRQPAEPPLPSNSATETPTATPSATPTPSSTTIAAVDGGAWTSPPAMAFGGDCGRLFTRAQVADFMGIPRATLASSASNPLPGMPAYSVAEHNGGMTCMWNDGTKQDVEPGSHPVLSLTVVPASAVPNTSAGLACVANNGCTFTAGDNGYLVGGWIGLNETEKSTMDLDTVATGVYDGITAALPAITAAAGTPPPAYRPRAGDWPESIDCDSLYETAGVWKTLGQKAVDTQNYDERVDGQQNVVDNALQSAHGLTGCMAGDFGATISFTLLSGGAWLEDSIAASEGVRAIQIDGADRALQKTFNGGEGDYTYDYVIDGANLLLLVDTKERIQSTQRILPGLLKTLDNSATATAESPAVITTAGWGDLKLGKPVPASTKLVTWKTVDPDQCMGNSGYWDLPDDPGAVLVRTQGNSRTGAIEGISLLDPSVKTRSGAHVGMSLADLKKLFPQAKVEKSGALYVVSDTLGQVVFDVGDKNIDEYYAGPAEKDVVLVVHVLPASTTPFSNQGTGFGPCA